MDARSRSNLPQGVLDRFESFLGFRTIRSAALGHVRTATAALPAKRLDGRLEQVDRVDLTGKVVGDANGNTCTAFVDGDQRRNSRADALLQRVNG